MCERGANRVCVEVPLWLLSLDPPEPPMLGQSDESCTPEPPPGARAAARSVLGVDEERAWEIRRAARGAAPVPAIGSLVGLTSDRAWRWRQKMLGRAPKTVLSTIAGLDDGRAWAMRVAMAASCREALDSLLGLDHPTDFLDLA